MKEMIGLVLFIQTASLVFYFKMLDGLGDYEGNYGNNKSNTFEGNLWYFIAGLNFLFVLRFIYVEIAFSYPWYQHIIEFISFGIALFIVIPTSIYYLIKRRRNKKRKNNKKR